MLRLLWLTPALPLAGFLLLVLFGRHLSRRVVGVIGAGSVGLSALVTLGLAVAYIDATSLPNGIYIQKLWTWWAVAGLHPEIALRLDALSLVMALVVTGVGFLIHLYSTSFMYDDEGYARFFAYMNLFVASMLVLLLASDLVVLLLGWEGVGMCSYLLIGFWYRDPANGYAARKAFVVTRIGDVALMIGLFLLFHELGTLDIQELMVRASARWTVGSALATTSALLLLGGAMGKSAQLPLQTWLPDAMAGPTPVSALIHATTMVTAGVYLVARTHVLFALSPATMHVVAVGGTLTLLIAGVAALGQRDIKRVLAYSTISQIGYMFLALGVGAWSAAIFHFVTHAFFKALLFHGAGAIIYTLHHEHDIYKMGGLRKQLPVTFWTFLAGSTALAGFPIITAGFYSKDLILGEAFASPLGGIRLWIGGLLGALLTGLYIFRVVFVAFFGEPHCEIERKPGGLILGPLVVLGLLSIIGGSIELPDTFGGVHLLSHLLARTLPVFRAHEVARVNASLDAVAGFVSLLSICLAWVLFAGRRSIVRAFLESAAGSALQRFAHSGLGFDSLYGHLLVRPYVWIARMNRRDIFDYVGAFIEDVCVVLSRWLTLTQNGHVRRYAGGLAFGAVLIIAIVMLA
jgi:NADH-quinone oxidoreductase subunit L